MSIRRTYWLDVARALAILSISLNHAVNRTFDNYANQIGEWESLSLLMNGVKGSVSVFSRIGVPIFLMLSGALLLQKSIETLDDVKRFYRHNLLGVFLTSELWYAIMFWCLYLFSPEHEELRTQAFSRTLLDFVETLCFVNSISFSSMWYIPMILCVYTVIPIFALVLKHLPMRAVALPCALIYLAAYLVPTANELLSLIGSGRVMEFSLYEGNVFSWYLLYVLAGYWVLRGGLSRVKTLLLAAATALLFAAMVLLQLYAYSQPDNYLVSYYFPLLLPCAAGLFELIRRKGASLLALRGPVEYLSTVSFGIYFIHIIIMSLLQWYMDFSGWNLVLQLLFLEAASILGSIVVIRLLSYVPPLKKYLFMIKD